MTTFVPPAFLIIGAPALAADYRTPPDGAPFCETRDELLPYAAALTSRDTAALERLQSCAYLVGGMSVDVLMAYPGDGPPVVRVRVFGNGTSADGYMLREGLEAANS